VLAASANVAAAPLLLISPPNIVPSPGALTAAQPKVVRAATKKRGHNIIAQLPARSAKQSPMPLSLPLNQ